MSEEHIGVQINGVLYVKLDDAKKLREGWDKADAEIEKLRAALEDAVVALVSAKLFILKKYGSTNPAREDAIKNGMAALGLTDLKGEGDE
jgi:hypothetical protein